MVKRLLKENTGSQVESDHLKNSPRYESVKKLKSLQTRSTSSSKIKTLDSSILREKLQGRTALYSECEVEVSIFF